MKRLAAVLVCFFVFLWVNPAWPCGAWGIKDTERGWKVTFYAISVKIRETGKSTRTAIRINGNKPSDFDAIQGEWARGKKPVITAQGTEIFVKGKPVAHLKDDSLFIRDKSYVLSVKHVPKPDGGTRDRMLPYQVAISRGDTQVASGQGMSFAWCTKQDPDRETTTEEEILDIRYRLAFYLVWRDLMDKVSNGK